MTPWIGYGEIKSSRPPDYMFDRDDRTIWHGRDKKQNYIDFAFLFPIQFRVSTNRLNLKLPQNKNC